MVPGSAIGRPGSILWFGHATLRTVARIGAQGGGVEKEGRPPKSGSGGGSPVYPLGFVGALVWNWQQATTPRDRALAVLKSVVWPAFLVYAAFRALEGAAGRD